ncbi:MAG: DUF2953 domain-containing protein [Clostridia bacterium]|nr:DUF2953 domain-containing protein [Clostridia bacterium]
MMIWFWIFISVFLLILLFLLFVPLSVFIEYNEKLFVRLKIGFLSFKISPRKRNDNKKEKKSKSTGKLKGFFKNKSIPEAAGKFKNFFVAAGKTVKYLFKKTVVKNFDLSVKIGAPDAAVAALRYGQVSSVVYPLCSAVNSFANPQDYKVLVLPDFTSEKINIVFKANIVANLMGIIFVVVKFIKNYKIESKK